MLNKVGYEIYIISLGRSVMMGSFLVRKLHSICDDGLRAIMPVYLQNAIISARHMPYARSPSGKAQDFDSCRDSGRSLVRIQHGQL